MIEKLSRAQCNYLNGFGITAIRIDPVGKVSIASPAELGRSPAAAALWGRDRSTAHSVIAALGAYEATGVDNAIRELEAAASRLGVTLSPYAAVMQRAKAAMAEINTRLDAAPAPAC